MKLSHPRRRLSIEMIAMPLHIKQFQIISEKQLNMCTVVSMLYPCFGRTLQLGFINYTDTTVPL